VSYVGPAEALRVDFRRPINSCLEVKQLSFTFSGTSIIQVTVTVFNQNIAACGTVNASVTVTFYLSDGTTRVASISINNIPRGQTRSGSAPLSPSISFSSLVKVDVFVQ
jgi:hypothetical protein